ncbi:MAG: hypothetical protein ABSC33_01295 [Candidatus Sulfotelmatobacter sp.]
MGQFEERSASGHLFSDAAKATIPNGFSLWGLPIRAQGLKPARLPALGGTPEQAAEKLDQALEKANLSG